MLLRTTQQEVGVKKTKRFYSTVELAKIVGCTPRALEARRYHGLPPAYEEVGKWVIYLREDIEPWLKTDEARAMRARASKKTTDKVCETTQLESRAGD